MCEPYICQRATPGDIRDFDAAAGSDAYTTACNLPTSSAGQPVPQDPACTFCDYGDCRYTKAEALCLLSCPDGWSHAPDGRCQAPPTYGGGCHRVSDFRQGYSAERRHEWSQKCGATWASCAAAATQSGGTTGDAYVKSACAPCCLRTPEQERRSFPVGPVMDEPCRPRFACVSPFERGDDLEDTPCLGPPGQDPQDGCDQATVTADGLCSPAYICREQVGGGCENEPYRRITASRGTAMPDDPDFGYVGATGGMRPSCRADGSLAWVTGRDSSLIRDSRGALVPAPDRVRQGCWNRFDPFDDVCRPNPASPTDPRCY